MDIPTIEPNTDGFYQRKTTCQGFLFAQVNNLKRLAQTELFRLTICLASDTSGGIIELMDAELLCPCEFQLVLAYNRQPGELYGRRIEPEVLAEILSGINKRFGDYSIFGPPGADALPAGTYKGEAEPSVRIEVAVLPDRVQELRQYVIEIGERLGQEAMYFIAGPPSVEIIQIEKTKGKTAKGGA